MKLIEIEVPAGVRYISDWPGYTLPNETCIINKTVTGCGFTEYCLRNSRPTILCSPRKILLENKYEQHQSEPGFFIVRNTGEKGLGLDVGIVRTRTAYNPLRDCLEMMKQLQSPPQDDSSYLAALVDSIKFHIYQCISNKIVPKILVTYDSFKHVKRALTDIGYSGDIFDIVIDEFQSIFIDAKFKASVELNFLEYLGDMKRVYFLSATPMIESYLDEMPEFHNLTYYEFKWPPEMISKPRIIRKKVGNIVPAVSEVLQKFLQGDFPVKALPDGTIATSKEVVVYVNSVTAIVSIIKKLGLKGKTDLVNILCSNESRNVKKLKTMKHQIGKLPLQGQPHKLITFCTRTVYLGADFYSTCASTIVASDCDIDSLTVDISLDLPQILGRQRLEENVFKNEVLMFYTLAGSEIPKSYYEGYMKKKLKRTGYQIDAIKGTVNSGMEEGAIEVTVSNFREHVVNLQYKTDYASLSDKTGLAVFNKLVWLADRRAWEISQIDYRDEIALLNSFQGAGFSEITTVYNEVRDKAAVFMGEFKEKLIDFRTAYRFLCESALEPAVLEIVLRQVPMAYSNYYYAIGPEKSKALGYQNSKLWNALTDLMRSDSVEDKIALEFLPGHKYTLKYIKEMLGTIYQSLGVRKTPKASDLEDIFEINIVRITGPDGKRDKGYKIVGRKKKS